MAYEPTEWKSGDVVTSAKLNKIEAGIASGGVLVVTDTEGTLDKTWQEIHDAAVAVVHYNGNIYYLMFAGESPLSGTYIASFYTVTSSVSGEQLTARAYIATATTGFPSYTE